MHLHTRTHGCVFLGRDLIVGHSDHLLLKTGLPPSMYTENAAVCLVAPSWSDAQAGRVI